MTQEEKLRQRFVKDYNLPINIFDEELFAYYARLYDFFPSETWYELNLRIAKDYNGFVSPWLDYCSEIRDSIIYTITTSKEYYDFLEKDIPVTIAPCGERSIYNEECDNKFFISIDLKKANFQALKYAGVINFNTYEDLIKHFDGDDYIANSKYLRQAIFGKMSKRTIAYERLLTKKVLDFVLSKNIQEWELFSFNNDELIFKGNTIFPNDFKLISDLEKEINDKLNIEVRIEPIFIHRLPIVTSKNDKVDAYERTNLMTMERKLKKASTTFFPQIYKLWKGEEITEKDRMFFFENQIATFNNSLKLSENGE